MAICGNMDQKPTEHFMGKVSETGELLLSEHQSFLMEHRLAQGRNLQKVRDMIGNHAPLKMLPITVCRCAPHKAGPLRSFARP
jgi:hypothetical protein